MSAGVRACGTDVEAACPGAPAVTEISSAFFGARAGGSLPFDCRASASPIAGGSAGACLIK